MERVVLVTGGRGGIGTALANRFDTAGFTVCVSDIAEDAAERYVRADLTIAGEAGRVVAETVARFGRLDVLINNAGVQKVAPVTEFPDADWERVRALSLDAAFAATRAALPGMIARGWGRIVNIASVHGLVASPFKSAYVAAKHGLVGFTKAVALEVAEAGVTVNAICPGYVLTPLVETQIADQMRTRGLSREAVIRDVMLATQPTRRFVEAEEVAELALYLAGDLARSITGTALPIDGGWTAR